MVARRRPTPLLLLHPLYNTPPLQAKVTHCRLHRLVSTRPPCDLVAFGVALLPLSTSRVGSVPTHNFFHRLNPPPSLSLLSVSDQCQYIYLYIKHLFLASLALRSPPLFPKSNLSDLASPKPLRGEMASLSSSVTIVLLLLFLHITLSLSSSSPYASTVSKSSKSSRSLSDAEDEEEDEPPVQKPPPLRKKPILGAKNLTKLLKPKKTNSTAASMGKIGKATNSTKVKLKKSLTAATHKLDKIGKVANATKVKLNKALTGTLKKSSNSSKLLKPPKPMKSNSTKASKASKAEIKLGGRAANSTKSSKKTTSDLLPDKSKTATTTGASSKSQKKQPPGPKKPSKTSKPNRSSSWMVEEAEDDAGVDLISDFRDLPSRLLPDLDRISTTSKAYISAANRGIAASVRPYVGKSFAPKVAPFLSSLFLALPLLLLALVFRRIRAYLSFHRLLVFIQAYLAIYFATLAVTALATGLEPLRFFYATSPGSYAWTQAAQTMGYVVYLVVQLIDLVTVFSPDAADDASGGGKGALATARALGLAQMVIGLGVGAHYYVAVFHRAVAGEPPRANWRVHAIYAACFVVICACARAERRKKVYEDGEDGKKS